MPDPKNKYDLDYVSQLPGFVPVLADHVLDDEIEFKGAKYPKGTLMTIFEDNRKKVRGTGFLLGRHTMSAANLFFLETNGRFMSRSIDFLEVAPSPQ